MLLENVHNVLFIKIPQDLEMVLDDPEPHKHVTPSFKSFTEGEWASLLAIDIDCASRAAQASSRRSRRRDPDNLEARAARAEALTQMGELSAARLALEGGT